MTRKFRVNESTQGVKALSKGVFDVTVMTPGQGSSGFYSEDMIKEYGPKVFTKGTPSFMNHLASDKELHERDLGSLMATLTEDARWDDEDGALKAKMKVRKEFVEFVEDFKDTIGLSIFTDGTGAEDDEGRFVVESLVKDPYTSVDFVVAAGRGGRVNEMVESAKRLEEATANDKSRSLNMLVTKGYEGNGKWAYVEDYDDQHVWFTRSEEGTFQQEYSTVNDIPNELVGDPVPVLPKTVYVPLASGNINTEDSRTDRAENLNEGFVMDDEMKDALGALKAEIIDALKPAPVETPPVDIAAVVESAVEAGLGKTARGRVVEAVKAGKDADEAINAEKVLRDEILAEAKAEVEANGGRIVEGAQATSVNDLWK